MVRREIVLGIVIGASIVTVLGMAHHVSGERARDLTMFQGRDWPLETPPPLTYDPDPEPDILLDLPPRPQPVPERVRTEDVPEPASHVQHTYRMQVIVRAYTPMDEIDRDSPYRDWKTAINKDTRNFPHHWGIAADPRLFPYGTTIRVPGYKPSTHFPEDHSWPVDDTGGSIRQQYQRWRRGRAPYPQIEVRFIHERSARRWGRQVLWIEVTPPRRP